MPDKRWRQAEDALHFAVRVIPNAARDALEGWEQQADGQWVLKIRLTAVPEDGKANKALIALLAKEWRCAKSDITLLKGETSRVKRLTVPLRLAAALGA